MLKVFLSAIFAVFLLAAPAEKSVFGSNPLQSKAQEPAPAPQKKVANVELSEDQLNALARSDEPELNANDIKEEDKTIEAKLSVELKNKEAFVYEPFLIELKISSANISSFNPSISVKQSGIKLLNPRAKFNELNKNEAVAKLWFIATNENAYIDEIAVIIKRGDQFVFRDGISATIPSIKALPLNYEFSNVVAKELVLKNFKASKFDEFSNLINLDLEVKGGNLSEFKLPFANARGGVENLKGGTDNMSAKYFVIVPSDIKDLAFSYYNTEKMDYEQIKLAIKPSSSELSTQTNLNPKTSEFATYKSIAIYVIIILCLLTVMLWRSFYGLAFAIIFGVYAFYDARPFDNTIIKAGAQVSILPTRNSTVFYAAKSDESVKILGHKDNFTKILLSDNKIGWVRNENIK